MMTKQVFPAQPPSWVLRMFSVMAEQCVRNFGFSLCYEMGGGWRIGVVKSLRSNRKT